MRTLAPVRRGVGVAPGTITLKLGGLGEMIVPEEPGWYTTLDCMPEYADQYQAPAAPPAANTAPSRDVMYDPYTDIPTLKGLGRFNGIGALPEYPTTIPVATLPPPAKMQTFRQMWQQRRMRQRGLRDVDSTHVRWDLIAVVGGASAIIALMVGLLAAKK